MINKTIDGTHGPYIKVCGNRLEAAYPMPDHITSLVTTMERDCESVRNEKTGEISEVFFSTFEEGSEFFDSALMLMQNELNGNIGSYFEATVDGEKCTVLEINTRVNQQIFDIYITHTGKRRIDYQ